jgi:hypothetical protein
MLLASYLHLMVRARYLHFAQSRVPAAIILTYPSNTDTTSTKLGMARVDHTAVLAELQSHQEKHPLSILKLAEPIITSTQNALSPSKRSSDVSNSEIENPTPTTLEADLLHYKVVLVNPVFG